MPLTSKQCIDRVCQYVRDHMDELPKDPFAMEYYIDGKRPWITDGTKPKGWRRAAKKKIGNRILRVFREECTIIDCEILVWEEEGQIVDVEHKSYDYVMDEYVLKQGFTYYNGINTIKAEDFQPTQPKQKPAKKVQTNTPCYGAVTTIEQLQEHILDALRIERHFEDRIDEYKSKAGFKKTPDLVIERNMGMLKYLDCLEKDLSIVEFSGENTEISGFGDFGDAVGFNTLPNGVSYLGVVAGGDWECPMLFIIYWDGDKLRAYIPTDGNPWDKKKKWAYGNSDDDDGCDYDKANAKWEAALKPELIIADIEANILVKEQ